MNAIQNRLREWRETNGLSQETAAHRMKVSVSTYQKWESGARTPSYRNQSKINRFLGEKR